MPEAEDLTVTSALYALAREACTGARVLDLSGGTGDGPALLLGWGARGVVATDTSTDAITVAMARAVGLGVEFVARDPCSPDRLAELGAFDLVLALDDSPRPDDRLALLATMRDRLKPGGIAIACFHVAPGQGREAAASLSATCREAMGAPTQILVGMQASGTILVDSEARTLDPARGIADREDLYLASRVAVAEGRIERARCLVMVWGVTLPDAAAIGYAHGAKAEAAPDRAEAPVVAVTEPQAPPPRRGWLGRILRRRTPPPAEGA